MSECIVEVRRIEEVKSHSNADALELAVIAGWQCVVPIGKYKSGDLVTYIPIDSMIPLERAERWGVAKYLSVKTGETAGRVRCARLRGEPSFGVVIEPEDPTWREGTDVRDYYGITKYVAPLRVSAGDAMEDHPLFWSYTDIENLRNFPGVFVDGEYVIATEKIHGTNCRIGMIEGELMAGSMKIRRQRPERLEDSIYWSSLVAPGVERLLTHLGSMHRQVILFGEVFGSKIQNLTYGHVGKLGFRAFDLLIDGAYLDPKNFHGACREFDVEYAPELYTGPFSLVAIAEASKGTTMIDGDHIREGVVVRPLHGRTDPRVGRVAMKYISDDYLLSKNVTDYSEA